MYRLSIKEMLGKIFDVERLRGTVGQQCERWRQVGIDT